MPYSRWSQDFPYTVKNLYGFPLHGDLLCYLFCTPMNLLSLFAVLLMVTQAPVNTPQQGGEKQDHATHNADKGNPVSQPPTQPTTEFRPIFQAPKWEPRNDPSQQKAGYWKEVFGPANLPSWTLVIVGGIAGFLAWRTLNAIKRQADLMEDTAKRQLRAYI